MGTGRVWLPKVLIWSGGENQGSEGVEAGGIFALEKITPLAGAQKLVLRLDWESELRGPGSGPAVEKGTW